MYDLTGFQRDLLYVIVGKDEPHGLAIKDELEDYYEKEIHHGRLYPNLDTLVDKGLVEKGQRDSRTNFYTLTQRGRRELEARREWENQYTGPVRDEETLLEIAEQLDTSTRDLIEGISDVNYDSIPNEKAERAQLCRCSQCGRVIGCEHTYCPEHR